MALLPVLSLPKGRGPGGVPQIQLLGRASSILSLSKDPPKAGATWPAEGETFFNTP